MDANTQPDLNPDPAHGSEGRLRSILLIHGTYAFHEDDAGTRWWQRGSEFCSQLETLLNTGSGNSAVPVPDDAESPQDETSDSDAQQKQYVCVPAGDARVSIQPWWAFPSVRKWLRSRRKETIPTETPEGVFHWSGDNSESSRREAATLLLTHLEAHNHKGPFHVIAHSHGGSILWHALARAVRKHGIAAGRPLDNLISWTTVATPFLSFKSHWGLLIAALPIVGLLSLLFMPWKYCGQWLWLADFWTQAFPAAGQSWQAKAWAVFCVYGIALLLVCLGLRLLWSCYFKDVIIDRAERPTREVRRHQRDDILSNILGLLVGTILGFLALNATAWPALSGFFRPGDIFPTALATIWLLLAAVLVMVYSAVLLSPFCQAWATMRRKKCAKAAWDSFGSRYLCLASRYDEAIAGLRAIHRGVRAEILPRGARPRESQLSATRRLLRRPEWEFTRQGPIGWFSGYLLLPLVIVKDWVLWPLYNEVFASLVDGYVLQQSRRRALGSDVRGLTVRHVADHPRATLTIARRRCPSPTSSDEAEAELHAHVRENAARALDRLRISLAADFPIGPDVGEFFSKAMAGDDKAADMLIHTSYFRSPAVRSLLADHILRSDRSTPAAHVEGAAQAATSAHVEPVSPYKAPTATRVGEEHSHLIGLLAWISRQAVKLVVLLAPVWLLAVLGYLSLYEYSRAVLV